MTTLDKKEKASRWKSCARWPVTLGFLNNQVTTDTHDTREQADAVCQMLSRDGLGGEGRIFPEETWTEEVGSNTVACLFSKQDLEDLIQACEHNQFRGELWDRCSNLADGMKQLLCEAFPPNAEISGSRPEH